MPSLSAEKHLKYFAKQIYTDRLMVCIIIVVAIAIIVIIVLAIAGKTPKAMKSTV
jgi:SNARE protein